MNIEKLDIPNLTENEWNELHDFTAELFAEFYPHQSKVTLEYVKEIFKESSKDSFAEHFVVMDGYNKIIAKARFSYAKPSPETKESDLDNVFIDFRVRKPYRRKKLATELLSYLLKNEILERHTRIRLSAGGSPGYEFCESFGGKITSEKYESSFFFDEADWEKIENLNSEAREKSSDVSVVITDGLSKEDEAEYYDIYLNMEEEILSKYDKSRVFNRDLMKKEFIESKKSKEALGIKSLIAWARDDSGKLVGLSEIFSYPDNPKKFSTDLTGVIKEHRKKGLSIRMKTELLLHVKKNFPHVKFIVTFNDKDNAVMRGINTKLGFVPDEPTRSFLYKTDELKKKLGII